MALNGREWYGPPGTQEYITQLESELAALRANLSAALSQIQALTKR